MTQFQVTVRYGNAYQIKGADSVDREEADRLARVHHFAGLDVRVHKLIGDGSVIAYELTH
jgi:hypothetical protein